MACDIEYVLDKVDDETVQLTVTGVLINKLQDEMKGLAVFADYEADKLNTLRHDIKNLDAVDTVFDSRLPYDPSINIKEYTAEASKNVTLKKILDGLLVVQTAYTLALELATQVSHDAEDIYKQKAKFKFRVKGHPEFWAPHIEYDDIQGGTKVLAQRLMIIYTFELMTPIIEAAEQLKKALATTRAAISATSTTSAATSSVTSATRASRYSPYG